MNTHTMYFTTLRPYYPTHVRAMEPVMAQWPGYATCPLRFADMDGAYDPSHWPCPRHHPEEYAKYGARHRGDRERLSGFMTAGANGWEPA